MNGLRKMAMENKHLNRIIFASTASLAVIVLLLTYILSSHYETMACEEIYRNASSSINQTTSTVRFLSESVNSLLLQCAQSPEVNKLFLAQKYSGTELYNVKRKLDTLRFNNSKIYSIYVYDKYGKTIFESGEFSQGFESSAADFYDTGFVEYLDKLDTVKVFTPVVRTVPVFRSNAPESSIKVLTFFYFEPYFGAEEKNTILAFNVDMRWMSDALGYFNGASPNGNNIEIVSRDGTVIFSGKEAQIGTQYGDAEVLEKIRNAESKYGYFVMDGAKRLISYSRPNQTGYEDWIFISSSDLGMVLKPIREVKHFVYLFTGIILLVSIIGLVGILLHLGMPIKQAFNKAKLLEKEQEEKRRREAEEYMKLLLAGDMEENTNLIRERFEQLHIAYDFSAKNRLVLISMDDRNSLRRRFRSGYPEVVQKINEKLEEVFGRYYENPIRVDWQDGITLMVVCFLDMEEEEQKARLQEIFDEITDALQQEVQCGVSFSLSSTGQSIKDLPFLLAEALEVHTYRYLYGYGQLLTNDLIRDEKETAYVYPKEQEKEILSALFAGKEEEALAAYGKYVEMLYPMTVPEIKISFLLLADAVKYASRNTVVETSNVLLNFEQFFAKIQSLETIEEVNHLFTNLFREIAEIIGAQKSTRYAELVDQVKRYVGEHYGKIDLSIQEIAESMDMSGAYLGRIFKQHTQMAFTEYLTRYRLKVACEELLGSEKTVNEISDSIGFTNSSYFYLVFKKYLNCTPTQYRKNEAKE